MVRDIARRVTICGLCCLPLLVLAAEGRASLLGEVRAAEKRLAEVRSSGKWNRAAETALVSELEKIAGRYHKLAETGAISGARVLSGAIRRLLERAQDNYGGELKRWQDRIIAADGDLEAAQDSPEWQEREALAARVQYWLNWVHYLAASRFERGSKEREKWLRDALEGFSSFAFQEEDRRLAAESLFGRGLTARELGRSREAAADLRRAAKMAAEPGTRMRAKMALADVLLERKDYGGALAASAGIAGRRGSLLAEREFLRSKAILLALKAGAVRNLRSQARLRSEATRLLQRLSARGRGWADRSRRLFLASIDDPEAWVGSGGGSFVKWVLAESLRAAGNYESALGLYRELLSEQPPADSSRASLLLASGLCSYKIERYREAFDYFAEAAEAAAGGPVAADAAYLKFKAAEGLYFDSRTEENARRLETTIGEYLGGDSRHRYRFEAYYRLGELQAREGRFLEASKTFAQVEGTPRFTLKARFLAAQTLVQELDRRWKAGQDGPPEAELLDGALAKINDFRQRVVREDESRQPSDVDRALVSPLVVKSALMSAKLRKHKNPPDWRGVLETLEGVSEADVADPETQAELMAARVEALVRLERIVPARELLSELIARSEHATGGTEALRELGVVCLEAAQSARAKGNPSLVLETSEMALSVYERFLAAADAGELGKNKIPGLRSLVAQLKREIARLRREAG